MKKESRSADAKDLQQNEVPGGFPIVQKDLTEKEKKMIEDYEKGKK